MSIAITNWLKERLLAVYLTLSVAEQDNWIDLLSDMEDGLWEESFALLASIENAEVSGLRAVVLESVDWIKLSDDLLRDITNITNPN